MSSNSTTPPVYYIESPQLSSLQLIVAAACCLASCHNSCQSGMRTIIMPCKYTNANETEWMDEDCRKELLTPILEDCPQEDDTLKSTSPSIWKHVLCGLPIGLAVPMSVRALAHYWFLRNTTTTTTPPPSYLESSTVPIIIYAVGMLVLLTNALYLRLVLTKTKSRSNDADKETATVGTMIGFCCAWVILDVVWYHTVDVFPVVLIGMYTCAYCKFAQKANQGDCEYSVV